MSELSISFEEAAAIRRSVPEELAMARVMAARQAVPPLSMAEVGRILLEGKREYVKAMKQALGPTQITRLGELRWQYEALGGLSSAIDDAIKLTNEQTKQIEEKENELGKELRERLWAFHRKSQRALHEVLTPEQRAQWQKRVGAEFHFDSVWTGISANSVLR